jgi:hypothetical protein
MKSRKIQKTDKWNKEDNTRCERRNLIKIY